MISLKEHIEISTFHNKENEKYVKQDEKFFNIIDKYKKTPYVYDIDGVRYVFSINFNDEDKFDEPYFPRVWDNDLDSTFDVAKKVKIGDTGVFVSCFCNVQKDNDNYQNGEPRTGDFIYDAESDDMFYCDVNHLKSDDNKDDNENLPLWFKKAVSKIVSFIDASSEYASLEHIDKIL